MLSSSFLFEFLNLIHIWLCQNSFTLVFFSFNCLHIFCIHAIFGVRSSLSRLSPENLTKNFHLWHCSFIFRTVLNLFKDTLLVAFKNFIILLIIFTSFTSVYLSFSIHPPLCFIRTCVVGSVSFIIFLSCLSIFFFFGVSSPGLPFFIVLSNILYYWHCTKYEVFHWGCIQ